MPAHLALRSRLAIVAAVLAVLGFTAGDASPSGRPTASARGLQPRLRQSRSLGAGASAGRLRLLPAVAVLEPDLLRRHGRAAARPAMQPALGPALRLRAARAVAAVRARLAARLPQRRPRLRAGAGGRPHARHHAEQAAGVPRVPHARHLLGPRRRRLLRSGAPAAREGQDSAPLRRPRRRAHDDRAGRARQRVPGRQPAAQARHDRGVRAAGPATACKEVRICFDKGGAFRAAGATRTRRSCAPPTACTCRRCAWVETLPRPIAIRPIPARNCFPAPASGGCSRGSARVSPLGPLSSLWISLCTRSLCAPRVLAGRSCGLQT